MAYVCKECGDKDSDWCDKCEELLQCDCSDQTYSRFKDLIFDCDDGEKTVTIRLHHCSCCGEVSHAEV